jgi:hypothetical protein
MTTADRENKIRGFMITGSKTAERQAMMKMLAA